jgi:hypothetical protein
VDDTQIDTLEGDHIARAPSIMMSMQQEELAVGKEEGPSEAVLKNEPMEEPGKKVVRLPAKQKNHLQLKETMWFKMEVKKLRK